MAVGLCIIAWSVGFVHKKNGPLVLLLLFMLLFLVGGGIAQILFFIPLWAVATRINKPLSWWRRILPEGLRRVLAKQWPSSLVTGAVLFVIGLVISITGYGPGLSDPEQILTIDWSILGIGYLLYLLAYVAGFSYDIEKQLDSQRTPEGAED
jgi:Mn2+/Fe2+ NRAMP family transporter